MNDIGKFLFLHFEKGLVALFTLGLVYSIVAYGPWEGRPDFQAELRTLSELLAGKPRIDAVPQVPDLVSKFASAGHVQPQKPLAWTGVWYHLEKVEETANLLPPASVLARPERGYQAVIWQTNTNQTDSQGALELVGVQVDRALLSPQGQTDFEPRTRIGDRDYMIPAELFKLAERVEPMKPAEPPPTSRTARPGQPATAAAYSIEDLFNALHDGYLNETQLRRIVSEGQRRGEYGADQGMFVQELFMGLRFSIQEARRSARSAGTRGAPSRQLTNEELYKLALEDLGFRGGGKFSAGLQASEVAEEISSAAEPDKPATPEPEKKPQPVAFKDVTKFVDTDVNPDLEYLYRVRFWALDSTSGKPQLRSSDYTPIRQPSSPKPDTEFFLTGISPDQGKAIVVVRKWSNTMNNWDVKSYLVAPGEQIGHTEILPKRDVRGQPIVEAGKMVIAPVDFSTGCVLLDFRNRPRVYENRKPLTTVDAATGNVLTVDSVEYVLYDTPQIVYSDRKGRLRVKWKGAPEAG